MLQCFLRRKAPLKNIAGGYLKVCGRFAILHRSAVLRRTIVGNGLAHSACDGLGRNRCQLVGASIARPFTTVLSIAYGRAGAKYVSAQCKSAAEKTPHPSACADTFPSKGKARVRNKFLHQISTMTAYSDPSVIAGAMTAPLTQGSQGGCGSFPVLTETSISGLCKRCIGTISMRH